MAKKSMAKSFMQQGPGVFKSLTHQIELPTSPVLPSTLWLMSSEKERPVR